MSLMMRKRLIFYVLNDENAFCYQKVLLMMMMQMLQVVALKRKKKKKQRHLVLQLMTWSERPLANQIEMHPLYHN